MDTILIVVVAVLVCGIFWKFGQQSREQVQHQRTETQTVRRALGLAQDQLKSTEHQLQIASGDYEQRLKAVYGVLDQAALGLDRVLAMCPYIESVDEMFARMTPEDFTKLDLPFAAEFQTGMTQLAAQKMEAIVKLNELGLRLALGMHYLKATGATVAPKTKFTAELLQQQLEMIREYGPKLLIPGIKEEFAEVLAINMERINTAYRNGEERPNAELVARFLQAIDEVSAEQQHETTTERQKPHVQTWRVTDADEVLYIRPVEEHPVHSNGNGSHKE